MFIMSQVTQGQLLDTRDHAARGRARSAARRRRRGEQWRPWPPERRVRCWCCCGGCWCCGAVAGWAVASSARAGPLVTVQPLCQPRRRAGTSGERPLGPRPGPDNGGSGRASPRRSRSPGPCPTGARGLLTLTLPWACGLGVAGRGLRGGVPACAARTLPEEPARSVRLFGARSREPADGQRPGNLPRAWDLLIPSFLPAPGFLPRGPRRGSR